MPEQTQILVLGATGRVGGATLRALRDEGMQPIALVRDPGSAQASALDVELRVADLEDTDALRAALDGVDALLLSSGHGPDLLEHQRNVIAVAQEVGVRRVVKISASPASVHRGTSNAAAAQHLEAEAALARTTLEHTSIRPNAFIQNLGAQAGNIADGQLQLTLGKSAISWVDCDDVGNVAAQALTTTRSLPGSIAVTGPEALTGEALAEMVSVVVGHQVVYRPVSDDEQRARMRSSGAPEWLVEHVVSIYALLRDRGGDKTSDATELWVGRPATPAVHALSRDASRLGIKVVTSTQEEPAR